MRPSCETYRLAFPGDTPPLEVEFDARRSHGSLLTIYVEGEPPMGVDSIYEFLERSTKMVPRHIVIAVSAWTHHLCDEIYEVSLGWTHD